MAEQQNQWKRDLLWEMGNPMINETARLRDMGDALCLEAENGSTYASLTLFAETAELLHAKLGEWLKTAPRGVVPVETRELEEAP